MKARLGRTDLTHPTLSAVCLAVWRNHHMRTVTNYFIVNLSLADVLVTAICLPASLLVDITESWLFGHALCKVIPYLQVSSPTPPNSLYHTCLTPTALVGPSGPKVRLSGKSQWLRTFAGSPIPPGWTDTQEHRHSLTDSQRYPLLVTATNLAMRTYTVTSRYTGTCREETGAHSDSPKCSLGLLPGPSGEQLRESQRELSLLSFLACFPNP